MDLAVDLLAEVGEAPEVVLVTRELPRERLDVAGNCGRAIDGKRRVHHAHFDRSEAGRSQAENSHLEFSEEGDTL